MKRFLTASKEHVLYYSMAYAIGGLFTINALACSITASFMNVEWADLSPTSKFLLLVLVVQNWSGVMLAYFSRTVARLQNNQPLIQNGDPGMVPTPAKTP